MTDVDSADETPDEKKARKAARKAEKDARKAEKKARKAERKRARAEAADVPDGEAAGEGDGPAPGPLADAGGLMAALQGAARFARTALATRLLAHGLYAGQEQVLLALDEGGPQALGDLADELGVRAPTITKTVARMETQGFLARSASADDARSVIIALTPAGRAALAGARDSLREAEAGVFGGLKKSERKALAALLSRIAPRG